MLRLPSIDVVSFSGNVKMFKYSCRMIAGFNPYWKGVNELRGFAGE